MTEFVRLNGWGLDILNETGSGSVEFFGETKSSFTNRPRRTERNIPRSWSFEVKFKEEDEVDTLEGLVDGRHRHWSFDFDPWSESGHGPTTLTGTWGSEYFINTSTPTPRMGFGCLQIADGESIDFDAGLWPGKHAVMWWFWDGAAWEHRVERNDGAKWVDGSRNDAASFPELAILVNGDIRFAASGSDLYIDDLVTMQFAANYKFLEQCYAWMNTNDHAFSSSPCLFFDGSAIGSEDEVEVIGRVDGEAYIVFSRPTDGTLINNSRKLSFTIHEKLDERRRRPPVPELQYAFESDLESGTLNLTPSSGVKGYPIATRAGTSSPVKGIVGPYGFNEGWNLAAPSNNRWSLASSAVRSIVGANVVTVLAWVQPDTGFSSFVVVDLQNSVNSAIKLSVEPGGVVRCGARAVSGDAEQVATSAAFGVNEWALIGCIVDLVNGTIETIRDVVVGSQGASFGATVFPDDIGASKIAADAASSNKFDGDISLISIYRRRLTPLDLAGIVRDAKRGVIR